MAMPDDYGDISRNRRLTIECCNPGISTSSPLSTMESNALVGRATTIQL
jgi:hypothetical protein